MPWFRPWKTVDQEMCCHLGVSMDVMQNMTDEEYTRANFNACQEAVRRSVKDKKERKAQLQANKKWFVKWLKQSAKNKPKEAVDNNNNIEWAPYEPENENWWKFFNEKGEEISDWDDMRWDEMNAWTF